MTSGVPSDLTTASVCSKMKISSSRFREPLERRLVLREEDHRTAEDLFIAGIADTKAMLLFRKSHKLTDRPLAHDARRLTDLWRAGFFTRIDQKLALLKGSTVRLYAFETGKAQLAYETRTHHLKITAAEWERIQKEASPLRRNALEYLAARGFPVELVESRIESNADALMRFYSGEPSQVPHRVLGSHALAILWYGARARGIPVTHRRPDGDLVFTAKFENGDMKIKPDCFFCLGSTGVALETETGSAGRAKVTNKIKAYLALFKDGLAKIKACTDAPEMTAFCVLFYTGTHAHARLIEDLLSAEKDPGTGFFRVVTAAEMGLDRTAGGAEITREGLTTNAVLDGLPVVTYLRDRIDAPIFRQKAANGFHAFPLLG